MTCLVPHFTIREQNTEINGQLLTNPEETVEVMANWHDNTKI